MIKVRMLSTFIYPLLLYGREGRTLSTAMHKRLEATEMWFYRKILRITYTDRIKNGDLLSRIDMKRQLIKKVRRQQMKFFGHVIRNEDIENLVISGKIEGKRSRGRARMTYVTRVNGWETQRLK